MPKSKREKIVTLTKTKKKGKALKEKLIAQLQECLERFTHIFVFSVESMKNEKMKEVREAWRGSKFFMGKNKVMAYALGRDESTEQKKNLHMLAQHVTGNCGLLFTNCTKEEVLQYFDGFAEPHYARSGATASRSFEIPAGPIEHLPFNMEPQLRKLGLPTSLQHGVIQLATNVTVCNEGDELTPEQCKILELWGIQMAMFKIKIHCMWKEGKFENLDGSEPASESKQNSSDADDDEEDEDLEDVEMEAPKKKKSAKGKKAKSTKGSKAGK